MGKYLQFLFSMKHWSCTYSLVSKGRGSTFSSIENEEEAEGLDQGDSPVEDTATEYDAYDTAEQSDLGMKSTFLQELMWSLKG